MPTASQTTLVYNTLFRKFCQAFFKTFFAKFKKISAFIFSPRKATHRPAFPLAVRLFFAP